MLARQLLGHWTEGKGKRILRSRPNNVRASSTKCSLVQVSSLSLWAEHKRTRTRNYRPTIWKWKRDSGPVTVLPKHKDEKMPANRNSFYSFTVSELAGNLLIVFVALRAGSTAPKELTFSRTHSGPLLLFSSLSFCGGPVMCVRT